MLRTPEFPCPGTGWIDPDLTNIVVPSTSHITLAWGQSAHPVSFKAEGARTDRLGGKLNRFWLGKGAGGRQPQGGSLWFALSASFKNESRTDDHNPCCRSHVQRRDFPIVPTVEVASRFETRKRKSYFLFDLISELKNKPSRSRVSTPFFAQFVSYPDAS